MSINISEIIVSPTNVSKDDLDGFLKQTVSILELFEDHYKPIEKLKTLSDVFKEEFEFKPYTINWACIWNSPNNVGKTFYPLACYKHMVIGVFQDDNVGIYRRQDLT